jgi:hypothetical protein
MDELPSKGKLGRKTKAAKGVSKGGNLEELFLDPKNVAKPVPEIPIQAQASARVAPTSAKQAGVSPMESKAQRRFKASPKASSKEGVFDFGVGKK